MVKNKNKLGWKLLVSAATQSCGYPTDSSDLTAAGAAGAVTFTPLFLLRRLDCGMLLTPSPFRQSTLIARY